MAQQHREGEIFPHLPPAVRSQRRIDAGPARQALEALIVRRCPRYQHMRQVPADERKF